jgi:hypothetical protein
MPPIETMDRHQTATLWEKAGDNVHGEPLVEAPEEISVRWEDRAGQARDPENNLIALDARVVLDREVAVGSILWPGELAGWTGTGTGDPEAELYQVVTLRTTPDLKARHTRRVAGLQRFRGRLPEGA